MLIKKSSLHFFKLFTCGLLFCAVEGARAVELNVHGVFDLRASSTDSLNSFRQAGYGKFDLNDGQQLYLAQAGGELTLSFANGFSTHLVVNGYGQNEHYKLGITEAFIKYSTLPNASGYRFENKTGIFYPEISLENNAIAWASQNTLNSSTINTWVGEEIRVLGSELSFTRLGKFNDNLFDLSVSAALFSNNDPAGTLLAWHGWTIGNRQTLWTEKVALPPLPVITPDGELYGSQSPQADPFYEVDNNLGYYLHSKIKWHQNGQFSLGYYNNNATPDKVVAGQYGWQTRFVHLATKWQLPLGVVFTSQYLTGDTLMRSPEQVDVVNNDYHSAYIAFSKRIDLHKVTIRLEEFSVTDNDTFANDNNNEYGKSATFNYTYRLSKPLFLSTEYSWLSSKRAARAYVDEPVQLDEQQLQFALRYFF